MESWSVFGNPKEVEDKKPSIFKDYILPIGALLIPSITFLAQNSSPWWGSLAIVVYIAIVVVFLVVPASARAWKKWRAYSVRVKLEKDFLPKLSEALRRFKPLVESNRSDTIWGVWSDVGRSGDAQKFIRPNQSLYYTLSAWLKHLQPTIDSGKASNFRLIATETSDWVQQYQSFCRDAYPQFEDLIRNGQLDEFKMRETKKGWNHARDEHNQAITNWKALCSEINASFEENICNVYYETLKTLE